MVVPAEPARGQRYDHDLRELLLLGAVSYGPVVAAVLYAIGVGR